MKKRILSLVLALALVMSLLPFAVAADSTQFTDVDKNGWYKSYVDDVVSKGYFKGTSATTFEPETYMTRAMFVTVLARLDGAKVDDSKSVFTDVPADAWYTGSVTWAAKNNIVNGIGDGKFAPNDLITREQMCTIMDRYLTYYAKAHNVTVNSSKNTVTFSDQNAISSWAVAAVASCVSYGLIIGTGDGSFQPARTATRAEVATVISRLAVTANAISDRNPGSSRTYTVTYYDKVGGTKVDEAQVKASDGVFTAKAALIDPENKAVFVSWATADGVLYEAGKDYDITGDITLYGQWLDNADYIGKAVKAAVDKLNASKALNAEDASSYINYGNDKLGNYGSVNFEMPYNPVVNEADTRAQSVTVGASVSCDVIKEIIVKSSVVACKLLGDDEGGSAATGYKAWVDEVVDDVLDEVRRVLNITDLSEATKDEIKNAVYNEAKKIGSDFWGCFFKAGNNEDKACAQKVKVSVNDELYFEVYFEGDNRIQINPVYAGSKTDKAKFAAKFAAAIAKDLYADLKNETDYTSVVELDAVLKVEFTDSATLELVTKDYPHNYPYTVKLVLDGGENVLYRFDGASYIKLNVTAGAQTKYAEAVEKVAKDALAKESVTNMVVGAVKTMDVFGDINYALTKLGVDVTATDANDDTLLDRVAKEWVSANLSNAVLKKCLNKSATVNFVNDAFYDELMDAVANGATAYVVKQLESKAGVDWKNTITTLGVYNNNGLDQAKLIALVNTIQLMTGNSVSLDVGLGTDYAATENYILGCVASDLNEMIWNNYQLDDEALGTAAMKGEIDALVIDKFDKAIDTASVTYGGVTVSVKTALEKVTAASTVGSAKLIKLGNLATLLKKPTFQSYVGSYGNSTIAKVTDYIAKLPAGANVKVNGITLNKAALADLQASTGTVDACNKLAALITDSGLGELTINSFAGDGVVFSATAKGRTYSFHLVIDVAEVAE